MRIAGIVQESIVDGPGLRMAVFTQGCPHRCPGCHNPESHDLCGGSEMSVEAVIALLDQSPLTKGLTLSGGDPMVQAADCLKLAEAAHAQGMNVWTYTGYTWEALRQEGDPLRLALLRESDVLVDGPYVAALSSYAAYFCGSTNQRLIDVKQSLLAGEVKILKRSDHLSHFSKPES